MIGPLPSNHQYSLSHIMGYFSPQNFIIPSTLSIYKVVFVFLCPPESRLQQVVVFCFVFFYFIPSCSLVRQRSVQYVVDNRCFQNKLIDNHLYFQEAPSLLGTACKPMDKTTNRFIQQPSTHPPNGSSCSTRMRFKNTIWSQAA